MAAQRRAGEKVEVTQQTKDNAATVLAASLMGLAPAGAALADEMEPVCPCPSEPTHQSMP